jgi:2-hydroxychromene-2-carboxylate isomerase
MANSGAGGSTALEFYFDPMCPYAYQTSVWIRDVRARHDLDITWRFFSLEEVNRPEGKRHPWERPLAYGWTPMRVAAWLRRRDMDLCDRWYEACGRALHEEGRRFYDPVVAAELLGEIGAPDSAWDDALADLTTHDDVLADHRHAADSLGGFGVPILVFPNGRALFGPVVVPAPLGDDADRLWDVCQAYASIDGLYEIKTPKTAGDLARIGTAFEPYLRSREWTTIQTPAP